ncbi:diguanylate cyclase [Vibrio hepatarius]|uniref:diguanylate cyclase n=1 Tax=Vibrio hepatarius TaxID=171383 RepID=UPI003735CBA7
MTDKNDLIHEIEHLRITLEEYHNNLHLAKYLPDYMTIQDLDIQVQVDDELADTALRSLQSYLLPKFENIYQQTKTELTTLSNLTLLFNLIVAPIIVAVSYFMLQAIRKVHKLSNQLSAILDISPDGILYISEQGTILQANNKACALLEYTQAELSEIALEQLVTPEFRMYCQRYRDEVFSKLKGDAASYKPQRVKALTKSNKEIDLEITLATGQVGEEKRTVCVLRDMTYHNALKHKAEKDHLTNLLNRWMLDELLQKEIDRCQRSSQPLSLLLVDIDNFKSVNDNLGHDIGDITLRDTARFLQESTRSYDYIGRWGGDEFILVCPDLSENDAISYAKRLLSNYNELKFVKEQEISLSIGIATTSPCSCDKTSLFKNADIALYHAKESGKNCLTHINQHPTHKPNEAANDLYS